ncbi:uncharacterized protein LOC105642785 [Jatropha curcas]|uniref:uncharacterized protein LOC105642785 n=1 Tax=Jatropha curcas TaxID=180498 RepID=UPI0005FB18B4|nr:uncharacterized protein LOC105642785 [Jatropha curcas]
MWAVTLPQRPFFPLIPKPNKPLAVSAASQPPRHRGSSLTRKDRQQIQNQESKNQKQSGAVTNQLSGLDVLWAMQRAAAEKNRASGGATKKNRKTKGLLSAGGGGQREEDDVDDSNVRPLCIKSEWSAKLDELDKRLQELSETK